MQASPSAPVALAPGARQRREHRRVLAAVVDLPDRLLAALCAVCVVVSAALTLQAFHPAAVLPVAAVAGIAVACVRLPEVPGSRSDALCTVLLLAGVTAWVVLNLPHRAEELFVGRDPGNYTLTAWWLTEHVSPRVPLGTGSGGTQGFDVVGDRLHPHGLHLVPGLAAVGGWLAGPEGLLRANVVLAGLALLALHALGRRVCGSRWALLPVLLLALSLPYVHVARSMYTEPLALALTCAGAAWLVSALRGGSLVAWTLSGLALGGVALIRIDGTLPLAGAVVAAGVSALLSPSPPERERLRRGLRRLAVPAVLLVVLGLAEGVANSRPYLEDHARPLALLTGLLLACLATAAWVTRPRPRLQRALRRLLDGRGALVLGGLLTLGLAVLASRPLWWESRLRSRPHPHTEALQVAAGVPVDGLRTYDELALTWLSWYWGWPLVGLGLVGLVGLTVAGARQRRGLLAVVAVVLPTLVLYSLRVSVFPDQVWAVRRFLPVAVPGLLVAAAWLLHWVWRRRRARLPVAAVVVLVLATPVLTVHPLWDTGEWPGRLAGARELCAALPAGEPVVSTGVFNHAATLRVVCGVDVVVRADPSRPGLAAVVREAGGDVLPIVTLSPARLPWAGEQPHPQVTLGGTAWERPLLRPPRTVAEERLVFTVGRVQADGTVTSP